MESLNGDLQITAFYAIAASTAAVAGTAQDQYAAMIDNNTSQPSAVWQYLSAGSENGKILLAPPGTNYAYLYNPLSDGNYDLVWRAEITQPGGLQASTAWTPIFARNVYGNGYSLAYATEHAFVMDPFNARHLLLGADQVYETTNGDYASPEPTWNPIGPPVPASDQSSCASGGFCRYVTAIAIATSASNYVYVATNDDHLWLTTNDGGLWSECDTGLYDPGGAVLSIGIDPNNPQHVFAVSGQWWGTSKVWELGSSSQWAQYPCQQSWVSRSGPSNLTAYAIAVDWRYSAPNLYIASDRGVFNSSNLGTSWTPFGAGLPNAQVFDLQLVPWSTSPATSALFAASYGRGALEILVPEPPPSPSPAPPLVRPKGHAPVWVSPFQPPWAEAGRTHITPHGPTLPSSKP